MVPHIWAGRFGATVKSAQQENKGPVISSSTPYFQGDNSISREATLFWLCCQIFLAAAYDKVSFSLASDQNGIYGSFLVELPLTMGTKELENHFTGVEAAHTHRGEAAVTSAQRIPLFQVFFRCMRNGGCGDSGFQWSWQITAEGYREGLVSQGDREAPLSPTRPYYKLFVIPPPAGPGTVKEAECCC